MSERKFDIEAAVERMREYWNTYNNYENYDEKMFINDALYGIGLSIDCKKYSFVSGWRKFAAKIHHHTKKLVMEEFKWKLKGRWKP